MPVYLWQNQRSFQVTVGSDNANNKLVCLAKLEKDKGLDAVGRQVEPYLPVGCVCTAAPLWFGLAADPYSRGLESYSYQMPLELAKTVSSSPDLP